MTLDPNIALGFRGLQIDDPMERAGRAMALSQMGVQNQFMQQKMGEANRLSELAGLRQKAYAASGGDSNKYLSALNQMGDIEGAQAFQNSMLETEKTRAEIANKSSEANARLQKLVSGVATGIHAGGSVQHAIHGAKLLRQYGANAQADIVEDWLAENPNATPDMIREAVRPYIASELDAKSMLMPEFRDAGGQLININPNAQFAPINKTASPDTVMREAGDDRRLAVREANENTRAAQNRAVTREVNKAPAGYRFKPDGNLEAIPGGPADVKNEMNTEANRVKTESQETKAAIVTEKVDEALSKVGFNTSGLTGKTLSMVPGTDAFDLDKTVETIKANLGFKELADMRAASPTGGALGQVAVKELEFLQSAVASLDVGQSEAQLRKNLQKVKQHYGNWKKAVSKAGPKQPSPAPSGGIKFLGFE